MSHGKRALFQVRSPVGRLAAALLLLVGALIVTDGLDGLSAPQRPWALRSRFAEAVAAAAADEQQQWEEQSAAAALTVAVSRQRQDEREQRLQQLALAGVPVQQGAPPPPLPPLHQQDVEGREGTQQQQQEQQPPVEHAQQGAQQHAAQQQQGQQQQALPAAPQPPPRGQDNATLAMCIAVKDEHCDIREWVLHHAQLGAGRFYVFDTGSDPPMEPVLQDLIASGLVRYSYLTNATTDIQLEPPPPGRSFNWQRPIYSLCLQRHGPQHSWMGFIDADEFVVLQEGVPSLPELLRGYEQHGGLGLHWQLFPFDRHVERPAGGLLASYTACCGREGHASHRHIKSFVQPRNTLGPQTVHSFTYRQGRHAVNTAGARLDGPMLQQGQQVSYQGAVLHHYISRSLADFAVKQERRDGTGNVKRLSDFLNWHRKCRERAPQQCRWASSLGSGSI